MFWLYYCYFYLYTIRLVQLMLMTKFCSWWCMGKTGEPRGKTCHQHRRRRGADLSGACEDQQCIDFLLSEARETASPVLSVLLPCLSATVLQQDVRRLMSEIFSWRHKVSSVLPITVLHGQSQLAWTEPSHWAYCWWSMTYGRSHTWRPAWS